MLRHTKAASGTGGRRQPADVALHDVNAPPSSAGWLQLALYARSMVVAQQGSSGPSHGMDSDCQMGLVHSRLCPNGAGWKFRS